MRKEKKGKEQGDEDKKPSEELIMLRKTSLCIVFLILFFISRGFSQEITDYQIWEEASAGNYFGVNARAMGMGGAQIATSNDASALVYNPACLAKIKRIEFSGGMTHQRLKNETGFIEAPMDNVTPFFQKESIIQSNTRFSSANIVLPVPTYRGSLVFALGVNRIKSFDMAFRKVKIDPENGNVLEDRAVLDAGGINMWSLGGAIDLSPKISIGGVINYWNGEDDYILDYYMLEPAKLGGYEVWWKDRYLNTYSGWNGKLGISVQLNKFLNLGGIIDFPNKFSIDWDYSYFSDTLFLTTGDETVSDTGEFGYFDLIHPYSFGAGVGLSFKYVTLAGDIYYTDWSQMDGKGENVNNKLYRENYHDVFRWHLGAEFVMPELSTKVRIGYYEDPIPFKSVYLERDRRYFTFGAGFLIDRVLTLDVAWNHGFYEFRDDWNQYIKEAYTADKIFISLAYRL